jgi:hypothetical protein
MAATRPSELLDLFTSGASAREVAARVDHVDTAERDRRLDRDHRSPGPGFDP